MPRTCIYSALTKARFVRIGAGLLLALALPFAASAATFTWDGGGANNNLSTANNWNPNSAPSRTGGHSLIFAGGTRLTPSFDGGGWTVDSITFASGAGAFTLGGGAITLANGVTNNSSNTQTLNNQFILSANQTWTAASGNIVVGNAYFNANSKNLTLAGSKAFTMNSQIGNAGTLTLSGSGNRTFNNTIGATTVQVNSTGTNAFNDQINIGTLNVAAGVNTFANVQASGGINISGSAAATFTGPVTGGSSGIHITSSGDIVFSGKINSGSITLDGTGTTTITGTGSKSTGAVVVNGGTLVMDQQGGGDAINNTLTVNSGGTVIFQGNNQIPEWQTVTLNEGSTILMNNTSQTFTNLNITGDVLIDFGGEGSQLNVQDWGQINITDGITVTIQNWNDAVDVFAGADPGDVVVNVVYVDEDGTPYATGIWGGGQIYPGAPIPEPSTYGALLIGGLLTLLFNRRPQRRNQAA